MSECEFEHTEYQPEDIDWVCPYCGENNETGNFYTLELGFADCELVHKGDFVYCGGCDKEYNADVLLNDMKKKKSIADSVFVNNKQTVISKIENLLSDFQSLKSENRSENDRVVAICVTDLEKVLATFSYWFKENNG